MRIAAPILGPVWLIELRVAIAGLVLLLLLTRLNLVNEIRSHLLPLFILGGLNSAIPFLLFAFAALYLPAGFSAILNATAPLFGTMITCLWLKEKLTWSGLLGLIAGFAGVIVLVGWTNVPITVSFIGATMAGLLAAFMYAIAAFYAKEKLPRVPSMAIATGTQLSAAIMLLPLTPFFLPTAPVSLEVITVVLALALFSTALAYILYFRLISNIGVANALTVAYLIPLFAMFWGATILKEPITLSMLFGCGLILGGTAIAVSKT